EVIKVDETSHGQCAGLNSCPEIKNKTITLLPRLRLNSKREALSALKRSLAVRIAIYPMTRDSACMTRLLRIPMAHHQRGLRLPGSRRPCELLLSAQIAEQSQEHGKIHRTEV